MESSEQKTAFGASKIKTTIYNNSAHLTRFDSSLEKFIFLSATVVLDNFRCIFTISFFAK